MTDSAGRRAFLRACAGGVVGLAGCTSGLTERGTETPTFQSDPWPMVHYDAQNTGYAPDVTGPQESVSEQWSRITATGIQVDVSCPVLASGRVYTGRSTDGDSLKAYSAADGEEVWGFGSGVTDSTPAIDRESVYFGNDGVIYAIDIETGCSEWTVETAGSLMTSVTVHDGTVYTTGGWQSQGLYAIDADSGSVEWTHTTTDLDEPLLQDPPAVDNDGVILAMSVSAASSSSAQIRHLAPDGEEQWRWESPVSHAYMSSPVVTNDSVFATVGGYGIVALDRATGTLRWDHSVESFGGTGGVMSAPAVADGVVYGTGGGRDLLAMTPDDGTVNWRLDLGLLTTASPVIAGEQLYIGTTDRSVDSDDEPEVLGINRDDGTVTWRWTAPNPVTTTPSIGDETLFVTTDALVHGLA